MPRERDDRRVVYSTTDGDLRKAPEPGARRAREVSGPVRVRREVAGRRGKPVTTISNLPLDDAAVRALAGRLKKRCGVGGSARDGVIELQGDHRETVVAVLRTDGHDVVLAGG